MSFTARLTTLNEADTMRLGEKIGQMLRGGEVIELTSDLGGGKTTLTKGIAVGISSKDMVSSPTFTISNVYQGSRLEIHHYDFYRLGELGLMSDELKEVLTDPKIVSVIEWAGEAHELLPKEKLVRIEILPVKENEDHRHITVQVASQLKELAQRLEAE